MAPAPNKSPKVVEDLFFELQREILSGNLAPGTRLPPERKLASAYGTNRNTLREAIRRLEQVNLVTVRHGQGVTVLDFRIAGTLDLLEPFLVHGTEPEEKVQCVTDLLAARTRILEYAMEFVIARATAADMATLGALSDELQAAWTQQDRAALADAYGRWLDALIDAANSLPARWIANPLIEVNRRLTTRFPGMWIMDAAFPEYVRLSWEALQARDLDAAVAAHRAYYNKIDTQVLSILGWVIQSGDAAFPSPDEGEGEARRRRREARKAEQRRRKLSAELAAAEEAKGEESAENTETEPLENEQ